MPYIHSYQSDHAKLGENFFKAITDVEGYELFKCKSIQYLIDYKWNMTKNFTLLFLFVPFFIFFLTFIIYSNVFNGQIDLSDPYNEKGFLALSILLYIFGVYFLLNELIQFCQNKLDYLTDSLLWNVLDLLPVFLIMAVVSSNLRQHYDPENYHEVNFIATIHAVASVLMWLKFMYFLRLFEATGYLIRIVVNMLWDMRTFILILFIVQIGFGEAFLRLSEQSEGDGQFLPNFAMAFVFAFRLCLGDNALDAFPVVAQPVTAWILFICCEVFTNIVMLNLLVTIIGQSFDTINENAKLANVKERAKLIYENSYLTKFCHCSCCRRGPRYENNSDNQEFLMIITNVDNMPPAESEDQMNEIKKVVDKVVSPIVPYSSSLSYRWLKTRNLKQRLRLLKVT